MKRIVFLCVLLAMLVSTAFAAEPRSLQVEDEVLAATRLEDDLYYITQNGVFRVDTESLDTEQVLPARELERYCAQAMNSHRVILVFRNRHLLLFDWHSGNIYQIENRHMSRLTTFNASSLATQACWSPVCAGSRILFLSGAGTGSVGRLCSLDLEIGILMESETTDLMEIALWKSGQILGMTHGAAGRADLMATNFQGRDRVPQASPAGMTFRGLESDPSTEVMYLVNEEGLNRVTHDDQVLLYAIDTGRPEVEYLLLDHYYAIIGMHEITLYDLE